MTRRTWRPDGPGSFQAPADAAEAGQQPPCCDLHRTDGCCDPEDCGPCCQHCPTCPTLARQRAAEGSAS